MVLVIAALCGYGALGSRKTGDGDITVSSKDAADEEETADKNTFETVEAPQQETAEYATARTATETISEAGIAERLTISEYGRFIFFA